MGALLLWLRYARWSVVLRRQARQAGSEISAVSPLGRDADLNHPSTEYLTWESKISHRHIHQDFDQRRDCTDQISGVADW